MRETFIRKNDIGIDIEYTILGYFKLDGVEYMVFTDFVSDYTNELGIRMFAEITGSNLKLEEKENKRVCENFREVLLKK